MRVIESNLMKKLYQNMQFLVIYVNTKLSSSQRKSLLLARTTKKMEKRNIKKNIYLLES